MEKLRSIRLIAIFLLCISCGFSPLYKDLNDINFLITLNKVDGNRTINNLFRSNFNSYNAKNSTKDFNIDINSKYLKNIIAKDTTGAATEYKLIVSVSFKVVSDNYEKEFFFRESFNMKSNNDKLEEQDYEENIKSNLVNIITRKLILQLSLVK
jgi:outer membrane lipopolysaccharide assembly protein LptE/RlpB